MLLNRLDQTEYQVFKFSSVFITWWLLFHPHTLSPHHFLETCSSLFSTLWYSWLLFSSIQRQQAFRLLPWKVLKLLKPQRPLTGLVVLNLKARNLEALNQGSSFLHSPRPVASQPVQLFPLLLPHHAHSSSLLCPVMSSSPCKQQQQQQHLVNLISKASKLLKIPKPEWPQHISTGSSSEMSISLQRQYLSWHFNFVSLRWLKRRFSMPEINRRNASAKFSIEVIFSNETFGFFPTKSHLFITNCPLSFSTLSHLFTLWLSE